MQRFKNKYAFITGGTSGMGFATAKFFIEEGGIAIITGQNQIKIDEAVQKLGDNAIGILSDAGNIDDLMNLKNHIAKFTDKIDVLYANAGFGKFAPIEYADENHFDQLFNVLVKGTFFTVQQVLPLMQIGGAIILNTSVVTEMGSANFSVYSAAKSAVKSFVKTFAAELASKGIRVNGISPGYINTNIFNNTGLTAEQIEGTVQSIIPTIPFKRFGEAEEVAKTVLFLASEDASYVHGSIVTVDAGYSVIR